MPSFAICATNSTTFSDFIQSGTIGFGHMMILGNNLLFLLCLFATNLRTFVIAACNFGGKLIFRQLLQIVDPVFLKDYDSYKSGQSRADVMRFYIMYYFGG